MRGIVKHAVLLAFCIYAKAYADASCAQDYDYAHFTCSYNSASQLGKLLYDHRYTDSLTLGTDSCKNDLKNSFSTPAELERFFSNDPSVSVGAPPDIISRCKSSNHLAGTSEWNEEVKASVAEYYTDLARLNNAVRETLQSIAAIDSMKGETLLSGVNCSIPELKSSKDYCAMLRVSCQPKGGNFEIAVKSKQNLIEKKKLSEQIRWTKENANGVVHSNNLVSTTDLSAAQQKEIDKINTRIHELEEDTPAIRDDSIAMNEINNAAKNNFDKNPNNPENISKISDETFSKAIWDNHSVTRELLLKRLNDLRGAASCLGGRGDCSKFDEVMEMDTSTEIPYLNIDTKTDKRTQQGLKAYNSGLCQSQARRKAREHGKIGNSVASALGLTAASFFIPPLAESAGVAWAGAFAIRSIDTYYAIDSSIDAYNACKPQLDQFHAIVQNEAKILNSYCPKSSDQPKTLALKNVFECQKGTAMTVLAGVPIVTALAKDITILSKSREISEGKSAVSLNPQKELHASEGPTDKFSPAISAKPVESLPDSVDRKILIDEGSTSYVYRVNIDGRSMVAKVPKDAMPSVFGNAAKIPEFGSEWQVLGLENLSKHGGPEFYGTTIIDGKKSLLMEEIVGKKLKDVARVGLKQCRQIESIVEGAIQAGLIFDEDFHDSNILIDDAGNVRLVDLPPYTNEQWWTYTYLPRLKKEGNDKNLLYVKEMKAKLTRKPEANRGLYQLFSKKGGQECSFLESL